MEKLIQRNSAALPRQAFWPASAARVDMAQPVGLALMMICQDFNGPYCRILL
ncbi:MAG: hypothetical protein JO174_04930 [Herbaspirillum sp.]|nr:hypothetical protein [Herbaspirillum sp.]